MHDHRRPRGPRRPRQGPTKDTRAHRFELLRAGWGAACLLAPRHVYRGVEGKEPDERARRVLRVLGARHLLQATANGLRPTSLTLGAGSVVDGLHAATALAFGLADASRRRTVLLDAGIAGGWSAAAWHAHRRVRRS